MKTWSVLFLCMTVAALLIAGCGGGKLPEEEQQSEQAQLPEGHPPVSGQGGPMAGALGDEGPTDDNALPLKLHGMNGVDELNRALAAAADEEAKEAFESGFRKTFTADAGKRDYPGAVTDLEKAIELEPDFAQAYRALGYAKFNIGFNVDAAMTNYQKAIELKPDYGEAHYALAFMYAMGDRSQGAEHFKKAMELGVQDERNLGDRFYSGD